MTFFLKVHKKINKQINIYRQTSKVYFYFVYIPDVAQFNKHILSNVTVFTPSDPQTGFLGTPKQPLRQVCAGHILIVVTLNAKFACKI